MSLALFDMDGTLINGDTNELTLEYLLSHHLADPSFAAPVKRYGELFMQGNLKIEDFIAYIATPFVGMPAERREHIMADLVRTLIIPRIKPGARRAIDFHKSRGDTVIIVTSTVDYLVKHVAEQAGIDNYIGSKAELTAEGVLTGKLAGYPPYQEGKVRLIKSFAQQHNLSLEDAYAYGDSVNDLPMLLMSSHPYAVDPAVQLRSHPDFPKLTEVSWLN